MNRQRQVKFGNYAAVRMLSATQVGYFASEARLTDILRSFNHTELVIVLARINLFLHRSEDLFEYERVLRKNFCTPVLQHSITVSESLEDSIIFHREPTLRLLSMSARDARRNSTRSPDIEEDARNDLATCYLVVNELLATEAPPAGMASEEELRNDLAELIAVFEYSVNSSPWRQIKHTIVRSNAILSLLQEKASTFDVNETFLEATTGLTLQQYQHLIFSVFAVYSRFSPEEILEGKALFIDTKPSPDLTPLYDKLLQHTCIPIDELAHSAETTTSLKSEFRPFRQFPLVKLSDDQIMCVDMGFLVDKIETGVFWIIRDKLEDNTAGKGEQIISLRGAVFEDYAASIVERGINAQQPPSKEKIIFKPMYDQKGEAECTDIAVYGGDTLILLECKAPLLSAKAKFSRDFSEFYKAIRPSVIKGIGQLWASIQYMCHTDKKQRRKVKGINISKIKKIYPVLALPDRLFSLPGMNRFLDLEFQRLVKRKDLKKHLADMHLTVLTISDLEDLEPYLYDKPFHVHLETWLQDFKRDEYFSFNQYLWSLMENEPRENSFVDTEFERIVSDMEAFFSSHGLN